MNLNKVSLKEKWIKLENHSIFTRYYNHVDFNAKSSVILVHGLAISGRYMIPLGRYLGSSFNVYLPDLPMVGKTPKPNKTLKLDELADVLADFAKSVTDKKAAFLGNSFGCQVIAELAVRHPEIVDSIILVGPTVDPYKHSFWSQAKAFKTDSPLEPKWQQKIAYEDFKSMGLKRFIKIVNLALSDRVEEKLPNIKAKSLVVRGGKDPFTTKKWVKEAALKLNGRAVEIPNKGHTLNTNSPEKLARLTVEFLEGN